MLAASTFTRSYAIATMFWVPGATVGARAAAARLGPVFGNSATARGGWGPTRFAVACSVALEGSLELSFAGSEAQEVKSAVVGVAEAKTAIAGIG